MDRKGQGEAFLPRDPDKGEDRGPARPVAMAKVEGGATGPLAVERFCSGEERAPDSGADAGPGRSTSGRSSPSPISAMKPLSCVRLKLLDAALQAATEVAKLSGVMFNWEASAVSRKWMAESTFVNTYAGSATCRRDGCRYRWTAWMAHRRFSGLLSFTVRIMAGRNSSAPGRPVPATRLLTRACVR